MCSFKKIKEGKTTGSEKSDKKRQMRKSALNTDQKKQVIHLDPIRALKAPAHLMGLYEIKARRPKIPKRKTYTFVI